MIGEELAEVEMAYLAEVVNARAIGASIARIERVELEDLADEVFGIVRKSISVCITLCLAALEHILPGIEVGDVVAIRIRIERIRRLRSSIVLKKVGKTIAVNIAIAVVIVPR